MLSDSDPLPPSVMTKSLPPSSDAPLPLPPWLSAGESVQVRPSYSTGVVAFVGRTEFAGGVWVGVELDAPTGESIPNFPKRFLFLLPH